MSNVLRPLLLSAFVWLSAACQTMPAPLRVEPVVTAGVILRAASRGLVPAANAGHDILIDMRYATPDNAFRRVLYPRGFPMLAAAPSVEKLTLAAAAAEKAGYRLVALDAYRPPETQWALYQMFRDAKFVADPRIKWSKHCYGRAVDVTLADKNGKHLRMPGAFDDFTENAAAAYQGTDAEIQKNLTLLQTVMTGAGFTIYSGEWWHFTDLSDPSVFDQPPVFGKDLGLPVENGGP